LRLGPISIDHSKVCKGEREAASQGKKQKNIERQCKNTVPKNSSRKVTAARRAQFDRVWQIATYARYVDKIADP
jgi:hypothetical protein